MSESPESILMHLDEHFASRDCPPPDSTPTRRRGLPRWTTLRSAWQADLAPWADRVVGVWLPLTPQGAVPWWPRLTGRGTLILAIQPQGWSARDTRRWIRIWQGWAHSHRGDPGDVGLRLLNQSHEGSPWVRSFPVVADDSTDSGWRWQSRTSYPPIAAGTDALDGTVLTQVVVLALTSCPPNAAPVVLADRWRQSLWAKTPQSRPLAALAMVVAGLLGPLVGVRSGWLVLVAVLSGAAVWQAGVRAWQTWFATYHWGPSSQ